MPLSKWREREHQSSAERLGLEVNKRVIFHPILLSIAAEKLVERCNTRSMIRSCDTQLLTMGEGISRCGISHDIPLSLSLIPARVRLRIVADRLTSASDVLCVNPRYTVRYINSIHHAAGIDLARSPTWRSKHNERLRAPTRCDRHPVPHSPSLPPGPPGKVY